MHAGPKSTKRRRQLHCLFALLGSACIKAAYRMLETLTPGQGSISPTCLFKAFKVADPNSKKDCQAISVHIFALLGSACLKAA